MNKRWRFAPWLSVYRKMILILLVFVIDAHATDNKGIPENARRDMDPEDPSFDWGQGHGVVDYESSISLGLTTASIDWFIRPKVNSIITTASTVSTTKNLLNSLTGIKDANDTEAIQEAMKNMKESMMFGGSAEKKTMMEAVNDLLKKNSQEEMAEITTEYESWYDEDKFKAYYGK